MELEHQSDLLRVLQGQPTPLPVVIGGAVQAIEGDRGDLIGLGHPVLKAVPVVVDAEGEEHNDGSQRDRSLPGRQHPEGLPQEHLRGEVACQPPEQDPAHQGQVREAGQQLIGEHSASESGAQGHSIFEQGTDQLDRHHVPGGFNMPGPVD